MRFQQHRLQGAGFTRSGSALGSLCPSKRSQLCAGVKYASRNVLQDAALREAIKTFTCVRVQRARRRSGRESSPRAATVPLLAQQLADHSAGVHRRRVCGRVRHSHGHAHQRRARRAVAEAEEVTRDSAKLRALRPCVARCCLRHLCLCFSLSRASAESKPGARKAGAPGSQFC